ncbi:MAG: hypothetical protein E3J69_06750 [Anaerolineales bacterium]|nr:MAG: hypothetical protein E3J69_06750 [Anaerolineales bacterium]
MKPIRDMTQAELGAYVQSHLSAKGIDVVLSGGAVVAIYTNGRYVSGNLDFVNRYFVKRSVIKSAIEELGFKEAGRHFEHHDTEYFVEFPPGPLAIGEEYNIKIDEFEMETGILRLISPTDCVKDRLVWYYHDGDRQCLSQAILVAQDHQIDIDKIREWSDGEGKLEEFEEIEAELQS